MWEAVSDNDFEGLRRALDAGADPNEDGVGLILGFAAHVCFPKSCWRRHQLVPMQVGAARVEAPLDFKYMAGLGGTKRMMVLDLLQRGLEAIQGGNRLPYGMVLQTKWGYTYSVNVT